MNINNANIKSYSNNPLPVNEVLKEAWVYLDGFKGTFWLTVLTVFFIAMIYFVILAKIDPELLTTTNRTFFIPRQHLSLAAELFKIITQLTFALFFYGILYLSLKRVAKPRTKLRMLFDVFKYPLVFNLIGYHIIKLGFFGIFTFVILTGPINSSSNIAKLITSSTYLISIIVVALALYYFIFRLFLSSLVILDKGFNPFKAIKLSYYATAGHTLRIFMLFILLNLIILISALPVGIGLIWSLPFATLVFSVIYKRLLGIDTGKGSLQEGQKILGTIAPD